MPVVQVNEVRAWASRWAASPAVIAAVVARLARQSVVPPFTGMPPAVVSELNALPLRALGELRDLFRPDLYPGVPHAASHPPSAQRPGAQAGNAIGGGRASGAVQPSDRLEDRPGDRLEDRRDVCLDDRLEDRLDHRPGTSAELTAPLRSGEAPAFQDVQTSLLSAQLDVLAEVVAGRSLATALGELILVLESIAPEPVLASVLLLDGEGTHLRHCAAPSLPQEYNRAVDGISIGPGAGSCGTAAHRGKQVIAVDIATDPLWVDYRTIALAAGLRACWSTPIFADSGALVGTFALYYPVPKQPHPQDLALVEVLARTVAMAIQRYHRDTARDADLAAERQVALTLQQRLLPQLPSHLAGVELHAAYRSGDPATEVGGDWYDAVAVPGAVYLAIGDVQGHDLEATALMGQLRTVLRAYAMEDLGPGQVLARASRYLQREPTERLATACVMRLDPTAHSAVVASAGHLPPLLVAGSSAGSASAAQGTAGVPSVQEVDLVPGVPLGLEGHWPEQHLALAPGSVLLLYTDGVVETRSWPLAEGIARLRAALQDSLGSLEEHDEKAAMSGPGSSGAATAGGLERVIEAAFTVVPVGQRGDDAMLLVARVASR